MRRRAAPPRRRRWSELRERRRQTVVLLLYSWALAPLGRVGAGAAFLYVICGALRLARFNVLTGITDRRYFIGLPIPGAAGVVASTVLFFGPIELDRPRLFVLACVTY